jgi:hypothetical protein
MAYSNERLELAKEALFAKDYTRSEEKPEGDSFETIAAIFSQKRGKQISKNELIGCIRDYRKSELGNRIIQFSGAMADGSDYKRSMPRYDHPNHVYAEDKKTVFIVRGDRHAPFMNKPFIHAELKLMSYYKLMGYRVKTVIAGDLLNASDASRHPKKRRQIVMEAEKESAQASLRAENRLVDETYIIRGNHDDWLVRLLDGVLNTNDYYAWLLSGLDLNKISAIDDTKLFVHSGNARWLVGHAEEYSKNVGSLTKQLSLAYQTNIISHHEHHLGAGRDDYNRYTWIANGMEADWALLDYVNANMNKQNVMKNAFTVLIDGTFKLFTPYPEWQKWEDYDIDPSEMYAYEKQKQQIRTGELDLYRYFDEKYGIELDDLQGVA